MVKLLPQGMVTLSLYQVDDSIHYRLKAPDSQRFGVVPREWIGTAKRLLRGRRSTELDAAHTLPLYEALSVRGSETHIC